MKGMSETTNDSVRLKILEILYKKAAEGTSWTVEREEMKQQLPIAENKLDFNMLYLHERKLAKIRRSDSCSWQVAKITGKGIDVFENKPRFAEELPFIRSAIQKPGGEVYDNTVAAVQSEVDLYQQVSSAFEQAYEQVKKAEIAPEKKQEITTNLKALEKELPKEKPNKNKVNAIWEWLRGNADVIVPTITEIVTKILNSSA
jgi:hypothetical protein